MGRQTPVDVVIKKLHKVLSKEDEIRCTEDHRIQVTEEGNGNLSISVEHNREPHITWLALYSDELEMDFDVTYNAQSGRILKDKKIKSVNEMIKFTGEDVFVATLAEKIIAYSETLAKPE